MAKKVDADIASFTFKFNEGQLQAEKQFSQG
jgi:hypothetical protein